MRANRGFPNEVTHPPKRRILPVEHIDRVEVSGGTETSKYPEEEKNYSLSSGERKGRSLNPTNLTASGPMFVGVARRDWQRLNSAGELQT